MGLIGGIARTAVVAGTATAVPNRVSGRQAGRWAAKNQQAYQQQHPVYAAPPVPAHQAHAGGCSETRAQLEKCGQLRASGVLTEDEFATQKAKILAL